MFGIGGTELLLIALIALLVIGPKHLPDMMRKLAGIVREVRRAGEEVRMHIDPDGELYRATHFPPNLDFSKSRLRDLEDEDDEIDEDDFIDAEAKEAGIEKDDHPTPDDSKEKYD